MFASSSYRRAHQADILVAALAGLSLMSPAQAGQSTDTIDPERNVTNSRVVNGAPSRQPGDVCVLGESGTGTVSVMVGKNCEIVAPPAAFGSFSLVSQFAEITPSVLIDCTKNTALSVGFTNATVRSARPSRTMKSSSGDVLQYNLLRPDGATNWDESNPFAISKAGLRGTIANQPFTYKARVNPGRSTVAAGNYRDNVSVVVTFWDRRTGLTHS